MKGVTLVEELWLDVRLVSLFNACFLPSLVEVLRLDVWLVSLYERCYLSRGAYVRRQASLSL
jgi:hypothetical protein